MRLDAVALASALGSNCVGGWEFGLAFVEVPPQRWEAAANQLRDGFGFAFFDWLTAYESDGGLTVAAHLWSDTAHGALLIRSQVESSPPTLPSLTTVWRGADWHEREAAEMFGLLFLGHPNPTRLLLADDFAGHPLRKDFQLPARDRPWPGATDPEGFKPKRRSPQPYGLNGPR